MPGPAADAEAKPFSRRALIVEDNLSWQQILAEILVDCGLIVDCAASLETACAHLEKRSYQLAVVDLSLDETDHHNRSGLQVLDAFKSSNPGSSAILLTGFATVELAVSAITEHGALTCLRKETFQRASFRELVLQALQIEDKVPYSPSGQSREGSQAPATPPSGIRAGESHPQPASLFTLAGRGEGNLQVLVVEDDPGWQGILVELLTADRPAEDAASTPSRLDVHLCSGYGEALGKLRREKFDLALIDLSLVAHIGSSATSAGARFWNESGDLSVLEGYRLLASTRAAGIPTIVVSGISDPNQIERAYDEFGIFAYLQKQVFKRQSFLQTVREALAERSGASELDMLTERERQVLDLLAQGMTNKEIADTLVISVNTVKRHLKAIFEKLRIHTRSAAAARSILRR